MQSNDTPSFRSQFVGVLILVGLVVGVIWIGGDAGPGAAGQSTARPSRLASGARSSPTATGPRVTPSPHATVPPRPTATPITPLSGAGEPGTLDIINLTSGNFTDYSFDVFVDFANNTSDFHEFISFNGVCRDDAGNVTGTSTAILSNVASGERTVATMTFIEVEPCNVTVSIGTVL